VALAATVVTGVLAVAVVARQDQEEPLLGTVARVETAAF
jgi:hypothetical protein